MVVRGFKAIAVALAVAVTVGLMSSGAGAIAQPSYDTIRIDQDGGGQPYQVWIDWAPFMLPTPDGGAWVFFSAQVKLPSAENPAEFTLGTRKLYAARFDPAAGVWLPARAMPGGEIQFGAAAVVDAQGTVHLVYTDRADAQETSFGTLVYVRSTPEGGWTEPRPVAPHENAGHQLSPELVLDGDGGLHVAWQDQRAVDDLRRLEAASNADVFVSDLLPDGNWSAPVQINRRPDEATNASRPQLAVDGDRLVAVWSVYDAETGLSTASRLEWSTRPLEDLEGWAEPQVLFHREDSQMGGRLLDLASDPNGGVVLVYGRRTEQNTLYLQRLPAGESAWSDPVPLISGNRGAYPRLAVASDGTIYVAYNLGAGATVHVGAIALAPGQTRASVEVTLTAGEEGAQGIPAIAIDRLNKVWLVYMHEPMGGKANEIRILRGAVIPSEPAPEAPVATPAPEEEPVATPPTGETPAG